MAGIASLTLFFASCREKDPCEVVFCKNGGTPVPSGHRCKCDCPPGFSGDRCEEKEIIINFRWERTTCPQAQGPVTKLQLSGTDIYAGVSSGQLNGAVYGSSDGGSTWRTITNAFPAFSSVDALAAGPAGVLISTSTPSGSHGLFRSPDKGVDWWSSGNGIPAGSWVSSLSIGGGFVYAGTVGSGFYISKDEGANWTWKSSGLPKTTVQTILPAGDRLYAGTNNGIYVSDDNGSSWSAANDGLITGTIVWKMAESGARIFAGTYGDGLYVSDNRASDWKPVTLPGGPGDHVAAIAAAGDRVFVSMSGKLYVSANNGFTWKSAASTPGGSYISSLSADGLILYAGTKDGYIWRSPL